MHATVKHTSETRLDLVEAAQNCACYPPDGTTAIFRGREQDNTFASVLLPSLTATNTLVLPRIFPAHPALVPCPLAAFPEPATLLPNHTPSAKSTRFDSVVLLATAPSTDHAIRPLVDMVLGYIVTLVTRVYLAATREAEPAV